MFRKLYYFFSNKYQSLFLEYKLELKPRYGYGKPPHKKLYELIDKNRLVYKHWLEKTLKYKEAYLKISKENVNSGMPFWNNNYFPGLDIITLFTIVSEIKPKTVIEVGSGTSTKIVNYAKTLENLDLKLISIDPHPRQEIDDLSDEIIREKFEDIDLDLILNLKKDDILFIDNTHRVLPNSDSMAFFMDVLPFLKEGVVVHIHDIFLPYDYPQDMCDRFYSEQYLLAMYLLSNSNKYEIIFPNAFISADDSLNELVEEVWQIDNFRGIEKHGGSFWFVIK